MTQDDILRKVQNLLDLAGNNSNEHEAALAASKAQELMLKHDLTMAEVGARKDPLSDVIDENDAYTMVKVPAWKSSLFAVVAETSNCVGFFRRRTVGYKSSGARKTMTVLVLAGRENDVAVAKYVYEYLVREMDRLAEQFARTVRTHGVRGALKHKRESWYLGAMSEVSATLRRQYLERTAGAEAYALVVVKDDAVNKYMADTHGTLRKTYRARRAIDAQAYARGREDGRNIGVNPAVGGSRQQAARPAEIGG